MRNNHADVKRIIYFGLWKIQADRFFRHLNRKKILILAYHGITDKEYEIAPWTLIHLRVFERQMEYIKRRYTPISLQEVAESIRNGKVLPPYSAVVTFDDGYKNNLSIALPVLEKYRIPATIFVTAGYIGSSRILPSDEIYEILLNVKTSGTLNIPQMDLGPLFVDTTDNLLETCLKVDQQLKKYPSTIQINLLSELRQTSNCEIRCDSEMLKDCRLLSWDDLRSLIKTDLIQIGAHTVSHEILTNVSGEEALAEILNSKRIVEKKLNRKITMFAYPNGTAADFNDYHIEQLKQNGFICGMTTIPKLNDGFDNPYRLGRFCIGRNTSATLSNFALRVSGTISALKPFKEVA